MCSKLMTVSWYKLAHMYVVDVNIIILFMIGQKKKIFAVCIYCDNYLHAVKFFLVE